MPFFPPFKTSKQQARDALAPNRHSGLATKQRPGDGDLGQPLAPADRDFFEARLGRDFSRVRVHTGDAASASARALAAKAYTSGEDIVFAAGRFEPGSAEGRSLLAHELAHVAQQQRAGTDGRGTVEARARAAADTLASGGQVETQALGAASPGIYCDEDDDRKPPEGSTGTTLPPLPNLTLSTPPPIDWFKMRSSFDFRGQRLGLREADDLTREWQRSAEMLKLFGIDERFKLGPITRDWILNKGLSLQLEDWQSRENPNALDRLNKEWKNAYPDAWQTPIVPIFDIDWFRSKKKK